VRALFQSLCDADIFVSCVFCLVSCVFCLVSCVLCLSEFPVNSMLCRKLRGEAYDLCDPRIGEKPHDPHHHHPHGHGHGHGHGGGGHSGHSLRSYSVGSASSNDSDHLTRRVTAAAALAVPIVTVMPATTTTIIIIIITHSLTSLTCFLAIFWIRLSRPGAEGDASSPPPAYHKMRSHRGKHRMQMFNYSAFNVCVSRSIYLDDNFPD
jgi:hypothetical protein